MTKHNHNWQRVTGTEPSNQELAARKRNDGALNSPQFKNACRMVEIKPTRRQASKFSRKMGLAYKYKG